MYKIQIVTPGRTSTRCGRTIVVTIPKGSRYGTLYGRVDFIKVGPEDSVDKSYDVIGTGEMDLREEKDGEEEKKTS